MAGLTPSQIFGRNTMNQIDLQGRVAVVTGGAQGIGRSIAERLLHSGASVSIWDIDHSLASRTVSELSAIGRALAVEVDVTQPQQVSGAVSQTEAQLGEIHILVNNAGIAGSNASVWEYSVDEWKHIVDVDLYGVFLCCRAVVPRMLQGGYGRIVNVASIAGKEGNPNASAYSAAKAGVIALTKSLGKELANHDIAVNCITPAAAKTAIFDQMSPQHIEYMLSKIPRGRFVDVSEIASLVAWLVSSENSFATAGVYDISGGRATY